MCLRSASPSRSREEESAILLDTVMFLKSLGPPWREWLINKERVAKSVVTANKDYEVPAVTMETYDHFT